MKRKNSVVKETNDAARFFFPAPSYLSAYKGYFSNGHSCNFSALPRPFYIVTLVKRGSAEYVGGNTVRIEEGEVLFIPVGATYVSTWQAAEQASSFSVYFSFPAENDPFNKKHFPMQKIGETKTNAIAEILNKIEESSYSPSSATENACVSGEYFSSAILFYELCKALLDSLKSDEYRQEFSAISPALAYLQTHYDKTVSLDFLSSLCCLSKSRFCHLFKEKTGISPIAYKNRVALNYAIQSLKTQKEKSIEEIANDYGISAVYFRKIAKTYTGKTPKNLRNSTDL